jgi:dimethylaniline monooxygenase (N-oxide forming)
MVDVVPAQHSHWLPACNDLKIFPLLNDLVRKSAGYQERHSDKGFENLEWYFLSFIFHGTSYLYRSEATTLARHEAYFHDKYGTLYPCDAILCGPGWKRDLHISNDNTLMELRLPFPNDIEPEKETANWENLIGEADKWVPKRFIKILIWLSIATIVETLV